MRTTLTVDDRLHAEIEELAHREGLSMKEAVNRVLAAGLEAMRRPRRRPYRPTTAALGAPVVRGLEKALDLASSLEDDEVVRELEQRR